jgi:hypothetical protein
MFKVGDRIKFGPVVGEIAEVHCKSRIGFNCTNEVSYDIILREVPEENIKQEDNGTD